MEVAVAITAGLWTTLVAIVIGACRTAKSGDAGLVAERPPRQRLGVR